MNEPTSRWTSSNAQRGADYDQRWEALAASGASVHGEADFICHLEPGSVLDAGCGTGRVAIELAARGIDVVGVDLDASMLDQARAKAPTIEWHLGDLATIELGRQFDLVAMPGNVMIFVSPGTEAAVVANLARHVAPGGSLVAGFQFGRGLTADDYDRHCAAAGLVLADRFSTWDGDPARPDDDYAVSVHVRS